jgi:hypothetical protein
MRHQVIALPAAHGTGWPCHTAAWRYLMQRKINQAGSPGGFIDCGYPETGKFIKLISVH